MTTANPVLVVSDLHLDRDASVVLDRFLEFLGGPARAASALYILGDLFEYWIGDDAESTAAAAVAEAICELGIPTVFLHGNRDFLLGPGYARRACMEVAPDEYRVDLPAGPTLFLHGDTLCTADVDYLRFRALVRDPSWQRQFLARTLSERVAEAERLRTISKDAGQTKPTEITDVHPDAVADALRRQNVSLLVHGHTHRPAIHRLEIDGRTCLRCVLPAWDNLPGYLEVTSSGPRLLTLEGADYPTPTPEFL
jgi:UDP-2,3-diacylglucosamine hydrolase